MASIRSHLINPILAIACLASALLTAVPASRAAENWPCWRGPRGDGTSLSTGLPVTWTTAENVVWKTALPGKGHASPIIWEDRIFTVSAIAESNERVLLCLDRPAGRVLWQKTALQSPFESLHRLNSHASSTPATDGERVYVSFLDETKMFVASLVYNRELNLLFLTCGFPEHHMLAIRPDGHGNVTGTHVVWRDGPGAAYVPSPVAIGPWFLVVADNGIASCFVAETGERLYRERLPGGHSASLIAANGLAYFLSDDGVMSVVRPGPELDIVAQNELGEPVNASPAVYGDQLFLRGEHHLYCIGAK